MDYTFDLNKKVRDLLRKPKEQKEQKITKEYFIVSRKKIKK